MPRRKVIRSPLDIAATYEVVWQQVAPIFEAGRRLNDPCYVYFIGEQDGPVKIGSAKNPILRLRSLQTGNPRYLRLEYVLLGSSALEYVLHGFWGGFAIESQRRANFHGRVPDTEWFEAKIRQELLPLVESAGKRQIELIDKWGQASMKDLESVAKDIHADALRAKGTIAHMDYLWLQGRS